MWSFKARDDLAGARYVANLNLLNMSEGGNCRPIKFKGFMRFIYCIYCSHELHRDDKTCALQLLSPFSPSWKPGITPLSVGRHCRLAGGFCHLWRVVGLG